jgi:hypothetical protein
MTNSHSGYVLLISSPVIAFAAWFGWMSYYQSRMDWIDAKVSQAMSTSIESLAPQWPRIEYQADLSGDVYYAPDIYDQTQILDLTSHVLETLNQDMAVPPVKITQVSIWKDSGTSEDTYVCQANVEFPLIIGVEKETVVESSTKVSHFTTLH